MRCGPCSYGKATRSASIPRVCLNHRMFISQRTANLPRCGCGVWTLSTNTGTMARNERALPSWPRIVMPGLKRGMTSSEFETEDMRPTAAWCDETHVYVTLANGRQMRAPMWWYPFLQKASPEARDMSSFSLAESGGRSWAKVSPLRRCCLAGKRPAPRSRKRPPEPSSIRYASARSARAYLHMQAEQE